jgi:prepilin-type N-terminal cleavage/methylation domain-containing protein
MKWAKDRNNNGFTIVELLIVIVVIGILAAIVIVAYNGVQLRSRDSARAQDIAGIKRELLLYQIDNGGVKATYNYSGSGPGGWNLSSSASWLTFLGSTYGRLPVDPINTGTTDPLGTAGLAYFYYCYNAGGGPLPATANVRLGYHSEATNQNVYTDFPVDKCL